MKLLNRFFSSLSYKLYLNTSYSSKSLQCQRSYREEKKHYNTIKWFSQSCYCFLKLYLLESIVWLKTGTLLINTKTLVIVLLWTNLKRIDLFLDFIIIMFTNSWPCSVYPYLEHIFREFQYSDFWKHLNLKTANKDHINATTFFTRHLSKAWFLWRQLLSYQTRHH